MSCNMKHGVSVTNYCMHTYVSIYINILLIKQKQHYPIAFTLERLTPEKGATSFKSTESILSPVIHVEFFST